MTKQDIMEQLLAVSAVRKELEHAKNPAQTHDAWTRLRMLQTVATSDEMITEILCQLATNQAGLKNAS